MSSINAFQVLFTIISLILITFGIQQHVAHARNWKHIMKNRSIADFTFFNARNLEDRLKLRAIANHRLVLAFGIENSFTTTKDNHHQDFRKKAQNAIRNTKDWANLSEFTKTILGLCVEQRFQTKSEDMPLALLVRLVTFCLVLHILFGVKSAEIDLDAAIKATDAINSLWIASKGVDFTPSEEDRNQRKSLDEALERLIPSQYQSENCTSPLSLIMPAYETLWRVVILTFVSVADRNTNSNTAEELLEAVKSVPQCFGQKDSSEMRALAIAKEGLRLYPPTKRIYRAMSTSEEDKGSVCADVEECQRNAQVWGHDALEFKPSRFHDWARKNTTMSWMQALGFRQRSEELKRLSYFPFGVGRHECPAAAGFGDKLITLLVVELARYFWERYPVLDFRVGNSSDRQKIPRPLPSGRNDMENWVVKIEQHRRAKVRDDAKVSKSQIPQQYLDTCPIDEMFSFSHPFKYVAS
ncbi:hypothetical protein F4861DRAFT_537913 [Xylaria intraflava]|nr:hypothetical protein F4861DRAFT_537913 [Xylaria intraflava]